MMRNRIWAACFALTAVVAMPATAQDVTVTEAAADTENWRAADLENIIVFETTSGRIVIEMLPDVAQAHAEQFRAIIRSGDYDGTSFHRVIDDFMAQGGDIFALKGRESGLPDIPGEFTFRRDPVAMPMDALGVADVARDGYIHGFPVRTQASWISEMSSDGLVESYIPHCPSVVSTARTSDPNSANSQFFLMRGRADHLDRTYTAWGRVIEGQTSVMRIRTGEPPATPDILQRAVMAADLLEGERPAIYVMRTDGPAAAAMLAERTDALAASRAAFDALEYEDKLDAEEPSVCDFDPIPAIIEFPGQG